MRCARCGKKFCEVKSCRACGRKPQARGLDNACYRASKRDGTLENYPRKLHPSADTLEDYAWLVSQGYTREGAANRLGIKPKSLDRAITRARRAQRAEA